MNRLLVGGVVATVLGVVVGGGGAGCGKPGPVAGTAGVAGDPVAALAAHKFWEKPVTAEQVEAILARFQALPPDSPPLLIRVDGTSEVWNAENPGKVKPGICVSISTSKYKKRPTREDAIRELREALDGGEFTKP